MRSCGQLDTNAQDTIGPEPWKRPFLDALRAEGSVTHAARAAGISRSSVYSHRQTDAAFAAEWEEIWQTGIDDLEASAFSRAKDGWLEPVYYKGSVCGNVRKFDNRLTWNFLQKLRAERYGDKALPESAEVIASTIRGILHAARQLDDAEGDAE